ncbi:MAG TPA: hypothetical protein VF615_16225 [Longimicrobiaceae bacterium]
MEDLPSSTWVEFLEQVPPGTMYRIEDLGVGGGSSSFPYTKLTTPDLRLHCPSDVCNGDVRLFALAKEIQSSLGRALTSIFMEYRCRNCGKAHKRYAVMVAVTAESYVEGIAYKYGEFPAFGPPVPTRVLSLIGPDRDIFLKGRRAENQGLGVGAFAYYRRVVENQKARLFDQIIKVAKQLDASAEDIAHLERAKNETQFTKAVEDARDAIPDVLKVRGHNPLILLYGPLSEGLHALSDDECLEIAKDVRLILYELAERIAQALKDEHEVSQAVSRLLARRKK